MKIVKEIFFYIVIIAAIVLTGSLVFYKYIPDTKTVPNQVNYTPLDTSKFELSDTDAKEDVILTHEVNQDILNKYEAKNQYEMGKVNPFGNASSNENTNSSNNSNNSNTNNNNTNTSTNTNDNKTDENKDTNNSNNGEGFLPWNK